MTECSNSPASGYMSSRTQHSRNLIVVACEAGYIGLESLIDFHPCLFKTLDMRHFALFLGAWHNLGFGGVSCWQACFLLPFGLFFLSYHRAGFANIQFTSVDCCSKYKLAAVCLLPLILAVSCLLMCRQVRGFPCASKFLGWSTLMRCFIAIFRAQGRNRKWWQLLLKGLVY